MALAPHSTGAIAQALSGIDFPASRDELVDYARKKGVDNEIISVIQGMPDEKYTTMADVFKGVGMSEH